MNSDEVKKPENQPDSLEYLTLQVQSKDRILAHASQQMVDFSTFKGWRYSLLYREVLAALFDKRQIVNRSAPHLWWLLRATLKFNKEDLFKGVGGNGNRPAGDDEARRHRLFNGPVIRQSDTAVIIHLFYTDLWDEIKSFLANLDKFDLFISIPEDRASIIPIISGQFPQSYIYRCLNRGRDIAPFVEIYSAIFGLGYHTICKIHTKKSPHLVKGSQWRQEILNELIGSRERVESIFALFRENPRIGMIAPKGYVSSALDLFTLTYNLENLRRLSEISGLPLYNLGFEFPAGSMFWFRSDTFSELARLNLSTGDFPAEKGQRDGTLAHSLERFFGLLVHYHGQILVDTSLLEDQHS